MSVRLPLAFLLGVAAAVLVACGGGSNKKLLPAVSADRLKNDLADIRNAVDQHDCAAAAGALDVLRRNIGGLPSSVDARLVARLREGAVRIAARIPTDCAQTTTTTTTPTAPTTTTPTTTTPTTPTTTTPTTTTPTTPTTTTTPGQTTTTGPSNGGTPPSTTP